MSVNTPSNIADKIPDSPTRSTSRDGDALEFLPAALEISDTPPHALGRTLAVVIALFFTVLVTWAALSPIDIVAVAEGRIVPTGQIKVIQSFQPGIVRAINIAEGDHVTAGQVLIEMDMTEVNTDRARVELDLARAKLAQSSAEALLSDDPNAMFSPPIEANPALVSLATSIINDQWSSQQSALEGKDSEAARIQSSLEALDMRIIAFRETLGEFADLLDAAEQLDGLGLQTNSQLANLRLQLISTKTELQSLEQQRLQGALSLEQSISERAQLISTYQSEIKLQLSESRRQIVLADGELVRLIERQELFILRAPVSGTINEITVHTLGAIISPSEPIVTIVPQGVEMEIEAMLLNKDVGFVEVGQLAEVKLEAFPFTRFGVINARIKQISPDAFVDERTGPVYLMRVKLDRETIRVGDKTLPLSPGMRATTEIKIGNRTILDFFLTPLLRYRDEAIRER